MDPTISFCRVPRKPDKPAFGLQPIQAYRRSTVSNDLRNKRVAALVENGFEQSELMEPRKALLDAGAKVDIVSPQKMKVKGWTHGNWGEDIAVDRQLDTANADDYDALLLPGGVLNPDRLRVNPQAVQFVKAFVDSGKPIAAICHGPWTLIEAGAAKGRTITSWPSLRTDLRNAGANWVDQEVAVDQGLVTSRKPDDLPAFNRKMIEEFAEGRHDRSKTRSMAGTTS
jgi:protease I